MKVVGLDGRTYIWHLAGHNGTDSPERPRSQYHLLARELLRRLYPMDRILEEVPLPGCPTNLWADFYLPLRKMMLEVQGEQHYRFIPHFHAGKLAYLSARGRDVDKKRWCLANEISLVELPWMESANDWVKRILAANGR